MRKVAIAVVAAVTLVIVILAGAGVLMNRYYYRPIGTWQIARVDRLSGRVCYSQRDGSWNSNQSPQPAAPVAASLTDIDPSAPMTPPDPVVTKAGQQAADKAKRDGDNLFWQEAARKAAESDAAIQLVQKQYDADHPNGCK